MIHHWKINVGPVAFADIRSAVEAELADVKEQRALRASNMYARAVLEANGKDPSERKAAMEAAESEKALSVYPPEVDKQVESAIRAAIALAEGIGAARFGVSLAGHFDEDVRDDQINHRLLVAVDQVK